MSRIKTYITGILTSNRRRNTQPVISKKLKNGEMVFESLDKMSVTKWKYKRDVLVISNAHVPVLMESVNIHRTSKSKPNVVHIYNLNISGIDRSDQMLSYHSASRKSIRWYKKDAVHIMEMFLSNAYYMYTKNTLSPSVKNMKEYKEALVGILIGPPKASTQVRARTPFHFLSTTSSTEKKKNRSRACRQCYKSDFPIIVTVQRHWPGVTINNTI